MTATKSPVDLLELYRTAIADQPRKRDPERGNPEHSSVPRKSIKKSLRSRLNVFAEKVEDPTLFERAESLMRARGIRPLAELLKTWGKGDITDVKLLRRSEPIFEGREEPKKTEILDVVKFDYDNERWSVYCTNDDNLENAQIDLLVEGNRLIGTSNVTIGKDPEDKYETVELGGDGMAIEILDDAYMNKGLCQIMLIVNLYYYFSLHLLSAADSDLPRSMKVFISSRFPLSAYKCYAKAAKTFGYFAEDEGDEPWDAAAYQDRMLEHYDKSGLRDSFSEDEFDEHFEFIRPPTVAK